MHFPYNKNKIFASKIWLIGRSYAAAIERTKTGKSLNTIIDDFWTELEPGQQWLDESLQALNQTPIDDMKGKLDIIFKIHNEFTEIMKKTTNLEKRSLSSKYLHFHCPNAFFIYDSRARKSINKLVGGKKVTNYTGDAEYIGFYLKVLELQNFFKQKT